MSIVGNLAGWYLHQAAEEKNVAAHFNLGIMYATGRGLPRDYAQAAHWFRKAAGQGHAVARLNLEEMLKRQQHGEPRGAHEMSSHPNKAFPTNVEPKPAEMITISLRELVVKLQQEQKDKGRLNAELERMRREREETIWLQQESERLEKEGAHAPLIRAALDRAQESRISKDRGTQIIDAATAQWQLRPGAITTNSLGMKFAWIPPGTFLMGSPESELERINDELQHKVTLTKGFHIGVYLVTQEEWSAVMGSNPSFYKNKDNPVEQVSWYDCHEFLKKLQRKDGTPYRLPTEAEWEYACRAGTKTPFYFGETISADQVNYDGSRAYGNGKRGTNRKQPTPVGSFPANPWGLYDMHGNVWEWCEDWYGKYSEKDDVDPQGPVTGGRRVLRGGSFHSPPSKARSAYRSYYVPTNRFTGFGVRLVKATS